MSKYLSDKYIINLNDDSKIPPIKNWNIPPYNKERTGTNYSILTGSVNDILVVDIDLLENKTLNNYFWDNLIKQNGKPKTLTVKTPTGGFHYYFKYDREIKSAISMKVNGQNTSIDILNESRDKKPLNVVGAGSTINDMPYKIIKDCKIAEMPKWLKDYIMFHQKIVNEEKITKIFNKKDKLFKLTKVFQIKDNEILNVLNVLNGEWLNEFRKWSIVTNILKGLDRYELWNEWSSKSDKYNEHNNNDIWNKEIPKFDINLLLNEIDAKPIPHTFKYIAITDIKNIDVSEQNERYVDLDRVANIGQHKKCIIIKSDTGTGKTTTTFKTFKKNEYKYILSIVTRRSLVNQHIENAKKVKIEMTGYEERDVNTKKIVCYQLDSIMKFLNDKRREDIDKYVVYMDEINSTLKYLINSSTMERKRIDIFHTLNFIIRRANLVICSDADVSDLVFKYLSEFRTVDECVFVHNHYKNYNNINAYKCDNINIMIDKIKNKIQNNIGFIACFDQLKLLDQIFYEVFDKEKELDFLKITSRDDNFTNTEIWKNKFVFYSPKIIYGNDFVPDMRTDIFVFSKGGSIDSLQIVQQATRCRIINDLYYYVKVKPQFLKYKNIEECRTIINYEKKTHYDILKELNCIEYDEEAMTKIKVNVYSEMFLYNEMIDDLLKSNYTFHFEDIIKNKGFTIIDLKNDLIGVSKDIVKNAEKCNEERFKKIKESLMKNTLKYDFPQYDEIVKNRADILKFDGSNIEIRRHADLLIDDNLFKEHILTSKLFRSMKANNDDFKNEMPELQVKNINNKLILIEYIEKLLNKEKFDFIDEKKDEKYDAWTNDYFKKYRATIRNYKCMYDNSYSELFKIRISLYKSINKNIFNKTRMGSGDREYVYNVDEDVIKKHLSLFLMRQSENLGNVNKSIIKKYSIKNNFDVDFLDEE